jgi:phage virion morphogenesis protein
MIVHIQVDDRAVQDALRDLQARARDTTAAMAGIAGVMDACVADNFRAEGRPRWAALKPSTQKARAREGTSGKILQRTTHLAGSITPFHSRTVAGVGTNVPYAAAMNNGVKPHHKKVRSSKKNPSTKTYRHPGVVARPFMTLTDNARSDIIEIMRQHLAAGR